MICLLDTNVCIALINGHPPPVRARFHRAITAGATIAVSSIVAFELWYGAAKSAQRAANVQRLEAYFAGPIDLHAFDDEDARAAGDVCAALEVAGTQIGAYDVLIAGQALRRGSRLVTVNVSEFARLTGLAWEDWASPT